MFLIASDLLSTRKLLAASLRKGAARAARHDGPAGPRFALGPSRGDVASNIARKSSGKRRGLPSSSSTACSVSPSTMGSAPRAI
jgi:hypothetical protein